MARRKRRPRPAGRGSTFDPVRGDTTDGRLRPCSPAGPRPPSSRAPELVTAQVVLAALGGAVIGLAADRLAARWPVHDGGVVRAPRLAHGRRRPGVRRGLRRPRGPLDEPARRSSCSGVYLAALIVLLATDLDQRLLPDLITLPLIVYAARSRCCRSSGRAQSAAGGRRPSAPSAPSPPPSSRRAAGCHRPALPGLARDGRPEAVGEPRADVRRSRSCSSASSSPRRSFAVVVVVLLVARRIRLRTAIPFGPALIGAGVVAVLAGLGPDLGLGRVSRPTDSSRAPRGRARRAWRA